MAPSAEAEMVASGKALLPCEHYDVVPVIIISAGVGLTSHHYKP